MVIRMRSVFDRRGERRRARQGQALVEFVLVIPLLLLLIFGLMDFARAWQTHHAMADAAREGARMLVVNETAGFGDAEDAIRERLAHARMDAHNTTRLFVDFDPGPPGDPAGRNEPQTVIIRYGYDFWLLRPFMGAQRVNLVTTTTMRGEGRN
jgi:hypothetical protein